VLASDAFFPFGDCVEYAANLGIKAILAPGGSIRDYESIDAANELDIALVWSKVRCFLH
jgi:phosphoribosylaminoimidazolecarboxamide formyltransferase/IMP cyclohydrolase